MMVQPPVGRSGFCSSIYIGDPHHISGGDFHKSDSCQFATPPKLAKVINCSSKEVIRPLSRQLIFCRPYHHRHCQTACPLWFSVSEAMALPRFPSKRKKLMTLTDLFFWFISLNDRWSGVVLERHRNHFHMVCFFFGPVGFVKDFPAVALSFTDMSKRC